MGVLLWPRRDPCPLGLQEMLTVVDLGFGATVTGHSRLLSEAPKESKYLYGVYIDPSGRIYELPLRPRYIPYSYMHGPFGTSCSHAPCKGPKYPNMGYLGLLDQEP